MQLKVTVNGVVYDVEVEVEEEAPPSLGAIFMAGGGFSTPVSTHASPAASHGDGIRAPLSGTVARVLVAEGQAIEAEEVLMVLEAMKMETEITAPQSGTVTAVLVSAGESVTGGQALVELG